MIPEAVTLATMALAMGAFGCIAGLSEADDIFYRINAGVDEDLDHGALLRERIAVGAIITLVLSLAYAWFLNLDGRAAVLPVLVHPLRLVATGWAWFTITHRLALNSARKKPWWYCAPGNNYDWRFIKLISGYSAKGRAAAKQSHAALFAGSVFYPKMLYKAGVTMFAFEGLVAGITLWSLWW